MKLRLCACMWLRDVTDSHIGGACLPNEVWWLVTMNRCVAEMRGILESMKRFEFILRGKTFENFFSFYCISLSV